MGPESKRQAFWWDFEKSHPLSQVLPWKYCPAKFLKNELQVSLRCVRTECGIRTRNGSDRKGASKRNILVQPFWNLSRTLSAKFGLFSISYRFIPKLSKYRGIPHQKINFSEEIRQKVYVPLVRLVVGVTLVMSLSVAISKSPSCKFILLWIGDENFWSLTIWDLLFCFTCTYTRGLIWGKSTLLGGMENNRSCICWQIL